MNSWVELGFVVVGTMLSVWGIWVSARAIIRAHQEYGDGRPILYWLYDGIANLRLTASKLNPWHRPNVTEIGVNDAEHEHGSDTVTLYRYSQVSNGADVHATVANLVSSLNALHDDVARDRAEMQAALCELGDSISEAGQAQRQWNQAADSRLRQVAAGDVRPQLLGVLLVAVGTALLAVPSIWDVLASLV